MIRDIAIWLGGFWTGAVLVVLVVAWLDRLRAKDPE